MIRFVIDRQVDGAPETNPFDSFNRRFLSNSKEIDKQYRPNQFQSILCCLTSEEHRRIVVTLAYTGMRSKELCQLRWGEVDFDRQLLEFGNGEPDRTKKKRSRRIPLNDLMVGTLLAQKEVCQKTGVNDPVFPPRSGEGERFSLSYLRKIIKEKTGDKAYTNHRLRHTFASWCLQADLDPIAIRDLLGHTTLSTTTRYARLVPDSVVARFRKLNLPSMAHSMAHSVGLED